MTERRDIRRDQTGRQVTGSVPSAKADAARSLIEGAGLAIEVVDEVSWRVGGFQFWPATGLWSRPGASERSYGTRELIAAVKAAGSQTG